MTDGFTRRVDAGLILVLAVALGLRVAGASFGLPAVYNPDEVAIMNRAMGLWPNGFNPNNFLYPSLYFYVLFAWEGIWFVAGRIMGVFGSLADFERAFFVDPSSIYLSGRLLTALCGVITVWATWRLGARLFDRTAGIAAAALLALSPLAVRDAHYVKHDVPVTLLVTLAMLLLAGQIDRDRTRARWRWIGIGIVSGLAMSTHYYAVFVLVPVAAIAFSPDDAAEAPARRLSRVASVAAAAGVAFLLTSPFLVFNFGIALRDMTANREIVMDRVAQAQGAFGSLAYFVQWLAMDAMGLPAAVLAATGLAVVIRGNWRRSVILCAFPAVFLLFLGNTNPASRYLNPVLPFMAIVAGAGLGWMLARGGWARRLGVAAGAAAVIVAATGSIRTDLFLRQTDTRTLAADWIAREIPQGASILIQPYSVPLRPSRFALEEALTRHLGNPDRASTKFQRQLALSPYPAPAYRTIYLGSGGLDVDKIYIDPAEFDAETGLRPLVRAQVTYVVMKRYNVPDPAMASIDQALERDGRLLATFSPYRPGTTASDRETVPPFLHNTDVRIEQTLERPGPIIEIWSIG